MAVEYDGGVIIGADSRTTSGYNYYYHTVINVLCVYIRSYIVNRVTDKLTPITDRIFCCRSGSAADTQAIADVVKYNLQLLR